MPDLNHWRMECPDEGGPVTVADATAGLPIRIHLPQQYVESYPYPLLVLFHPKGGNERTAVRLAPKFSDQNFIYLSLRGPEPLGKQPNGRSGFGWACNDPGDLFAEYVKLSVELARRTCHIHSERVYLVGIGDGAEAAYRAALTLAGKVAGVIAVNGTLPRPTDNTPVFRMSDARQLRVFQADTAGTPDMARDYKALYASGADVRYQQYPAGTGLPTSFFRDVNRWIVEAVNAEHDLYAIRD